MDAKDTVMTHGQLRELYTRWENSPANSVPNFAGYRDLAQAEVSFKAGQIQGLADAVKPGIEAIAKSIVDGIDIGRREVVEWSDGCCSHRQGKSGIQNMPKRYCEDCWQAQKKKWGIK